MISGSLLVSYQNTISEMYATAEAQPNVVTTRMSNQQTSASGNERYVQFTRPFTGPSPYFGIANTTQSLLLAWNDAVTPTTPTALTQHTAAFSNDMNFFDSYPCPNFCYQKMATDPKVCSSKGSCGATDSCTCLNGYTGPSCSNSLYTCAGLAGNDTNVCAGRGYCSGSNSCTCTTTGYAGANCDVAVCFSVLATSPTVCNSRGTCVGPNTCTCNTGYQGDQCQTVITGGAASIMISISLVVISMIAWLF
jgi:hypothetical protein